MVDFVDQFEDALGKDLLGGIYSTYIIQGKELNLLHLNQHSPQRHEHQRPMYFNLSHLTGEIAMKHILHLIPVTQIDR